MALLQGYSANNSYSSSETALAAYLSECKMSLFNDAASAVSEEE
jgi:hypothetical protein